MKTFHIPHKNPIPYGTGGTRRHFRLALLCLGYLFMGNLFTTQLLAQSAPTGSETGINTTTANTQQHPAVAMDTTGDYVITWQSWSTDGSNWGIYGQRFTAGGTAAGTEFLVNTTTSSDQESADAGMDGDGDFVITWMSMGQDGDGWGIYAQRYNAAGVAQGSEFQVNTTTAGNQKHARIGMAYNGDFVITWTSEPQDGSDLGIYAQRYNAAGVAQGAEFQVNTTTAAYQGHPDIAVRANGDFVIAWQSLGQDGSNHGVYFQRYNAAGTAQGAETQAHTTTSDNQQAPALGIDGSGKFVLTWTSYNQDGDNRGVYARRFDAAGVALAAEYLVNTTTAGTQDQPDVMVSRDGDFTIAWSSYGQDGSYHGVYSQEYDAAGVAQGGETLVNTRTADFQQAARGAWADAQLERVIVWMDGLNNSSATHDGDGYGIYAQRFTAGQVPITATAVCQDITIALDGTGSASIVPADVDGGSTSNDPGFVLSLNQSAFTCADIGQNSVQLTVTATGNVTDVCTAVVTVEDNTPPQNLTCPANMTVGTDFGNCTAVVTYTLPTYTDNCSANLVQTAGLGSGSAFPQGITTETFTVTDAGGNTVFCSFSITVVDNELPQNFTCPNSMTVGTDPNLCTAVVNYALPTFTDNCSASLTQTAGLGTGAAFPVGATTETWTVTDGSGIGLSCSFTITVEDNQAPAITCPANMTVGTDPNICTAVVNYTAPTYSDNCAVSLAQNAGLGSGATFPSGTTTETWTAIDGSGNAVSCSFTITVQDNQAPSITCPANMTVAANWNECGAWVGYGAPAVTDNCSPNFLQNVEEFNGHYYFFNQFGNSYTGARAHATALGGYLAAIGSPAENSYVASKYGWSGWIGLNDEAAEGIFQWENNEPIVFANWNLYEPNNAGGNEDYTQLLWNGTWNDLPDAYYYLPYVVEFDQPRASVNQTGGQALGSYFGVGTHTQTWTATDDNGNTSSCSFTISVVDYQAPTMACPADQVVFASGPSCLATAAFPFPTATDNCTPNFVQNANPVEWNGHYYHLNAPASWNNAASIAASQNGYLVSIGSAAENAFVDSYYWGDGWIGLNDVAWEGWWQWANGEPLVYANFGWGEPNNAGGIEDYASIRWDGQWNDLPEYFQLPFMTEFDMPTGGIYQVGGVAQGSVVPVGSYQQAFHAKDAQGNISGCTFWLHVVPGNCFPLSSETDGSNLEVEEEEDVDAQSLESHLTKPSSEIEITAFPNPFQDATTIRFRLPEAAEVTIDVYSLQGIKISSLFEGAVDAGVEKEVVFEPEALSSGVYYYRLTTSDGTMRSGKLVYRR